MWSTYANLNLTTSTNTFSGYYDLDTCVVIRSARETFFRQVIAFYDVGRTISYFVQLIAVGSLSISHSKLL